jgi:hypothetical protein
MMKLNDNTDYIITEGGSHTLNWEKSEHGFDNREGLESAAP